ncbi:MAG: methyltransferase [Magnetococcales bacterium]|nr:methyltransferase [Magnetococcales bacterium]
MNGLPGVPPGVCRRVGGGVEGRLLADMARARAGERLAELGSGCGEVAIRVALRHPDNLVDALELQGELNRVARRLALALALAHGVAERLRILDGDVRSPPAAMTPGGYALVLCNPPFFSVGAGRLPPDPLRAAARFELNGTLADFCRCAARLLSSGGRLHLVLRPERLAELPAILGACGLEPPQVELARSRPDTPPFAALITARKA